MMLKLQGCPSCGNSPQKMLRRGVTYVFCAYARCSNRLREYTVSAWNAQDPDKHTGAEGSDAMIGYWQEEVESGRMDPKEAFELLVGFHGEMMDLRDKQHDEVIELLRSAGKVIITHKIAAIKNERQREGLSDVIESLNRTIFQTWCYLGSYTNDQDDATHAKRLLQNCLLVRGPEDLKAAVKKKLLSPPPVKWWERQWVELDYAIFGLSLWAFSINPNHGWGSAPIWVGLAFWGAWGVAHQSQTKGGAHVQA